LEKENRGAETNETLLKGVPTRKAPTVGEGACEKLDSCQEKIAEKKAWKRKGDEPRREQGQRASLHHQKGRKKKQTKKENTTSTKEKKKETVEG